ncbi:DUF6063 family protein [Paenibacillus alginolyticus]|uniref:DUF6063 family protein n=2 Tax=Paenibacillus alginolyticus TaxID=59839 RepID=UPI002ADD5260|nr:DUF6063 family protein [Paenibacillus alginolyticus]
MLKRSLIVSVFAWKAIISLNNFSSTYIVIDIGNQEITLTEKAKVVVQRYFMELEYNRGILEFLYQSDSIEGEGSEHASDL